MYDRLQNGNHNANCQKRYLTVHLAKFGTGVNPKSSRRKKLLYNRILIVRNSYLGHKLSTPIFCLVW